MGLPECSQCHKLRFNIGHLYTHPLAEKQVHCIPGFIITAVTVLRDSLRQKEIRK